MQRASEDKRVIQRKNEEIKVQFVMEKKRAEKNMRRKKNESENKTARRVWGRRNGGDLRENKRYRKAKNRGGQRE